MHVIHRGGLSYAVILLSGLVVACGTTNVGATYVDEVLASGPTLYWRLDDTTAGVGGALDSSGRGQPWQPLRLRPYRTQQRKRNGRCAGV